MQKKLLVIKEGQHLDTEMYIKAIKREAKKRNVLVDIIDIEGIKFVSKDNNLINKIVESNGIIIANPVKTGMELINKMLAWKEKDIDNFTGFAPYLNCTLEAITDILKEKRINISGKDIVVLGRNLGQVIGDYMQSKDATIQICHSKTKKLKYKTVMADIIVCCGKANDKILTPDMVADGTIIIDVGNNTEGYFNNTLITFKEIAERNIEKIFKHMEG